jgi:hypothetical protein
MGLDDVYGRPRTVTTTHKGKTKTRTLGLYSRVGRRNANAVEPDGFTGCRAVAVDYSGRSGAPCLMVLYDRISRPAAPRWLWTLPGSRSLEVKVAERSFELRQANAVLRATFLQPAAIELEHWDRKTMTFIARGGSTGGKPFQRAVDGIAALAPESAQTEFLVVVTLQEHIPDAPPLVPQVRTEGTATRITVGNQTVTLDNDKLTLRDGPQ